MGPYTQGDLDGLCGFYSVINAVKHITKRTPFESWQFFFLKLLRLQLKHRKSANFIVYGISEERIAKLLQYTKKLEYGIFYSRPFKHRKRMDIAEFWQHLEEFLTGNHNRCIIICYITKDYSHWTVITAITKKQLVLLDSSHKKYIRRRTCSTDSFNNGNGILIEFTSTFFLEGQ